MIITEEAYLRHAGVKGMQWGVRKQQAATVSKATGRVAWKGTKAVGRGAKKVALWSKDHPKKAATIAVGALWAASLFRSHRRTVKFQEAMRSNARTKGAAAVNRTLSKLTSNSVNLAKKTADRGAFKVSTEGRLLNQVRKGKFGG